MKKIMMISQPMKGLTEVQIVENRRKAIQYATDNGYEVINSHFTEYINVDLGEHVNKPVFYLSKAIEVMSKCDTVYFCPRSLLYRGCRIEYIIARFYGLNIIDENDTYKR